MEQVIAGRFETKGIADGAASVLREHEDAPGIRKADFAAAGAPPPGVVRLAAPGAN